MSRLWRALLPAALVAATAGAAWARQDYRSWVALGPGGRPHTLLGWLDVTRLRLMKHNPLDLAPLERRAATISQAARLDGPLPDCPNPRPAVDPHPIPHRVVGVRAPDALLEPLQRVFDDAARRDGVRYARSWFERHSQAVTAAHVSFANADGLKAHGEIGHIHPTDSSMHMVLHPLDAAEAVRRGWGELHFLSDGPLLPTAYVMVYPPQRLEDIEVIARLLRAAADYVTDDSITER